MHSLARYSKRTVHARRRVPHHNYQVSGSFNSLLRVLFNVPSRYWFRYRTWVIFRVGGWCPPYSYLISKRYYSRTRLNLFSSSATGLSPFIASFSKDIRLTKGRSNDGLKTPHFHYVSITDSVCLVLLSVALTYSISFDFFSCWY